ncbi:outer membrane protein assembly factor BamB family protein [Haladaptatus salinisoli]|uniref:outer membrane protein assembly factor BamB family protein n=1 Tax=Haladaptatus salinisoli TaxID=2884876 RepID=UPI001D0AE6DC|nr:PQQ-binding-like beta-propeller repeat protein [Haladaptatus salinisoli]
MSGKSQMQNSRRTFLKTVGITMGVVGYEGTTVTAGKRDTERESIDGWTTVRANPGRTGAIAEDGPTPYPTTNWKMDLNGSMYNVEPIAVNGCSETVYLAVTTDDDPSKSQGYIGAYDVQTGDQRWKQTELPAPRTPAFNNGILYFATRVPSTPDADAGGFYALNAKTGEIKWSRTSTQKWANPIVTEDYVYTANSTAAYALDQTTGTTVWKTNDIGGLVDGVGAALSYSDGTIFFGEGTALDASNGSVKWRVADDQVTLGNHAAHDGMVYYIRTEFVVGDDDRVSVTARSADDGTIIWTYESNGSNRWDGRLAVADGYVLLLNSNDKESLVKALDAATGELLWTAAVDGSHFSSPVIADETVYIGGRFAPDSDPWNGQAVIYALDLETGARTWAYLLDSSDLETSPENPPAAGTPVVSDGNLYAATYPSGSTLTYRYVSYSNFFVLGSCDKWPGSNHRRPTDSGNNT